MATSLAFLFFGALLVAGLFSIVKIQREELLAARAGKQAALEADQKRQARLAEYRAKCYQRVDGD